jgi:hypothetical protein
VHFSYFLQVHCDQCISVRLVLRKFLALYKNYLNVFHLIYICDRLNWSQDFPEFLKIHRVFSNSFSWAFNQNVDSSDKNFFRRRASFRNSNSVFLTNFYPFFLEHFASWHEVSHLFVMFSVNQHHEFFMGWVQRYYS